ncbi:hypothetical protein CHISP_3658 [Chitinispirillum alkaliphilum]|nr:hypothetical protein CHISP_3658 [Chitinispirillum alkaliphilum]
MKNLKHTYDNFAPFYEYGERALEVIIRRVRKKFFQRINHNDILEVGIGSGRTIPYYRIGTNLTAGDLSLAMMRFARKKALFVSGFSLTSARTACPELPVEGSIPISESG